MFAKSLIDNELHGQEGITTCYFFFKEDNTEQQSVEDALCAILHNLFSQKPELLKHADPEFKQNREKLPTLFSSLWKILISVISDPSAGEVICVLDALDECEKGGRNKLIRTLSTFYNTQTEDPNPSRLKFLVTSRPYFDIERQFNQITSKLPTIRLAGENETEAISREINTAIATQVQELQTSLVLDAATASALQVKLCSMSHRTYLWLQLIFELINEDLQSLTEKRLQPLLDSIPDSVDQAYSAILNRAINVELATKLLHLVCVATRPLTLSEMRIAIAIEKDSTSVEGLDLEPESNMPILIRNLCGLFVRILEDKVYLIHQTAKRFLLANESHMEPSMDQAFSGTWRGSLEPRKSNLVMAHICMKFLLFSLTPGEISITGESLHSWTGMSSQAVERLEIKYSEGTVQRHTTKYDEFGPYDHDVISTEYPVYPFDHDEEAVPSFTEGVCEMEFLEYAGSYWSHHYKSARIEGNLYMIDLALKVYELVVMVRRDNHCTKYLVKKDRKLFNIASRCGHIGIARYIADGRPPINASDEDDQKLLCIAARYGDIVSMRLLMEKGADLNFVCPSDLDTPLSNAIRSSSMEAVQLLLEKNVSIISGFEKAGPRNSLQLAIESKQCKIVDILLKYGAKIDEKDTQGETPLHWAVRKNDVHTANSLLKNGAAINEKDMKGKTPLHQAVRQEDMDVVNILLRNGAAIDVKDIKGSTPLLLSSRSRNPAITKLLLAQGAAVDVQDNEGHTALSNAIDCDNAVTVALLLTNGASVDMQGRNGRTPLSIATRTSNVEIVRILLQHGADICQKDEDGMMALDFAQESDDDCIRLLISHLNSDQLMGVLGERALFASLRLSNTEERGRLAQSLLGQGIDINARGCDHNTLLIANIHEFSRVKLLLDKGADPNARGEEMSAPLHHVTDVDILLLLLRHNAKIDIEDENGIIPLQRAALRGNLEVVKVLLDNGANKNHYSAQGTSVLQFSLACRDWEAGDKIANLLIKYGCDLSSRDLRKPPPIHWAVAYRHRNQVKLLLKHGADINSRDASQRIPLHVAMDGLLNLTVIRILLDSGADVNARDEKGLTPLHLLVKTHHPEDIGVVKLLLAKGASILVRDNEGQTPLDSASKSGNDDVVKLLQGNSTDTVATNKDAIS